MATAPVIPHRPGNSAAQDLAAYNKSKGISTGALAKDPKFKISNNPAEMAKQLEAQRALYAKGNTSAKTNIVALKAAIAKSKTKSPPLTNGPATPAAQTPEQIATGNYYDVTNKASDVQEGLLGIAQNRGDFNPQTMGIGQFNPGDFQQQFQGAYDTAMSQFNRSSEPAFAKQKQDFDQFAAERGIDPTSDQYRELYKARISDPQETARLNAQDTAYQTGLGAQQQAYGQASGTYGANLGAQGQQYNQASSTYSMPFQNLSALSPYLQAQYGMQQGVQQQGFTQANQAQQQEYAKELAALQQKYAMESQKFAAAHQNSGGGGGGGGGGGYQGLSLADQMALQNNQFYNNMVLGGMGGGSQNPGMVNSGLQGVASGIGAGITAGLAK